MQQQITCVVCAAQITRGQATIGVCHLFACKSHLRKSEDRIWFRVWARFMSVRPLTMEEDYDE